MGRINCSVVDTTPGSSLTNPFCPPVGFDGSSDDYILMCKKRYSSDLAAKMWMSATASYANADTSKVHTPIRVQGPYKEQAKYILRSIIQN